MSQEKELFEHIDVPPCATTGCLHELIRDLRCYASELKPNCEHQGVSGLVIKTKNLPEKQLTLARRHLRDMADSLARQMNERFNEEALRRPAPVLQIHWPAGAELLDIQDGTAMIRGTLVLLGNRRIAYLGSDMNGFQLSSGFFLQKDGDSLRVVESPVEEHIENGRTIVRYPRRYWAKGTAWENLRRRYKVTKDNNPWRKAHDSRSHGWTAPLELVKKPPESQKQHGDD